MIPSSSGCLLTKISGGAVAIKYNYNRIGLAQAGFIKIVYSNKSTTFLFQKRNLKINSCICIETVF